MTLKITESDFEKILKFHDTDIHVEERPAYRILQDCAHKYPDRRAVVAADRTLSYRELNEEANAVGNALISHGAGPESIVAVLADRNSYAYVMRQGVLKSGGAFLPIDPDYPEDRVRFILKDSGAGIILTTEAIEDRRKAFFAELSGEGIDVIKVGEILSAGDRSDPNVSVPYEALAYVIYTSGSTGRPKGVMLTNKNLVNFVDDNEKNREIQGYTKRTRTGLALAALTFDVSIMEEFIPLSCGMTVVMATQEDIMDPDKLSTLMLENNVEVMTCTPSYISNLLDLDVMDEAIKGLKSIDIGAESFPEALYEKLTAVNPNLYIMNGYGPTETTISCTMQVIGGSDDITIGIPNANVHVLTMDENGEILPLGDKGELVILGDGVGRGYIGDIEQNKNFISIFGKRAYKTGDLARIRHDGNIEFYGRKDNQVKLRGLRIELGEVEKIISSFEGINNAVVIVKQEPSPYLAAYYTSDSETDIQSLKKYIKKYLTSYMVPQCFMRIEKIPLTLNGKVDKSALPEPVLDGVVIVPASDPAQEKLLEIVKDILKTDMIGIRTDLFEMGLSSLGAIRLCSMIREDFGAVIKTSELNDEVTVEGLEQLIATHKDTADYSVREMYPLSMTQMGIYIEQELHKDTTIYNIPSLYKLGDNVDIIKLTEAVTKAVAAHPYLFMTPVKEDGNILVKRRDDMTFEPTVVRCDHLPPEEILVHPFDLDSDEILFRAEIYITGEGTYFLLDTHHIVSDGGSIDILVDDIDRIYLGKEVDRENYTGYEFALDEQRIRGTDRLKSAKGWYDNIFSGCMGETLPVKDGSGELHAAMFKHFGEADAGRIREYCEVNSLSLNAFFTAAFGLAIQSYTSGEQAVFTTIYNGRSDPRLERSVSMLVKTLPVMFKCEANALTASVIEDCQSFLVSAMANDIYSFAEIKNAYDIKAELMFAFQGEAEHSMQIGGEEAELTMLSLSQARAAIGVDVMLDGDRVYYEAEYDPSEYSEYTVEGLVRLMDNITGEFLNKKKISEILLVNEAEAKAIEELHDTDITVPERPAYRILQDSAHKYPDRTAIVATDRSLSYKELNEEANALGRTLAKKGIGPEKIVAILADRDSFASVMRQGVLKSGGAFLQIDPEYPDERIRFIVSDSGAALLLTTDNILNRKKELLMGLKAEGLEYITVQDALLEDNRSDLNIPVPYEALAYVIYTSGSTGKPKGVMLTNKNLVNFVDDNEKNRETQGYTKRARAGLATAALTFDVSIMEEFIPLSCGMTTVLATQEEILDPGRLSSLMLKNKVDVMTCTPSYISNLLDLDVMDDAIKGLKSIDIGAESFPEALYEKLTAVNPNLYIMNGYGPTETTISCTMQVIGSSDDITIGIPNANVHVATFDRNGRLQPRGALGELVIIGDGVGRGYIGRDELTKKSFINLFGKRAYRAGDLVRIRKDGNIEFHGRLDDQVKLRGLRIELGEVQNAINSFKGIVTSIVVVTHGQTDYLAAYFTSESKTDIEELKKHLRKSLAEYMIPQAFMQLDEMPLTANGKVDKKALPVLEIAKEEIVPPENDLEAELLEIAGEVIGSNDLGVTSSLVSLGLSSIGAIRLSAMIDKKLAVLINVAQIMKKPTIRDIAGYIEDNTEHSRAGIEVYEKRDLYPITENQRGLLIDWQKNENTTGYNIPEVYLFKDTDAGVLAEAIRKTVDAHSYLKTHFVNDDGDVKLRRCDEDDVCVSIQDLDQVPGRAYFQTRVRPFDLFNDNLYRFEIYTHAGDSMLFADIHHTVYDGMSSGIFMEDLNRALSGEAPKSESLTAYDYALYEKKLMDSDDYKKAQLRFDGLLDGVVCASIPADGNPDGTPDQMTKTGVPASLVDECCKKMGVTPGSFLQAAFAETVRRICREDKIFYTTVSNGRSSDPALLNCVGMFVRTIPVVSISSGAMTVEAYIRAMHEQLQESFSMEFYPYTHVVSRHHLKADMMFVYQGGIEDDDDRSVKDISLDLDAAKLPITLFASPKGSSYELSVEYDGTIYGREEMDRFVSAVAAVCEGFTKASMVRDVSLVTVSEQEKIISLSKGNDLAYDREKTWIDLFLEQVKDHPDKAAVIAGNGSYTYGELNRASDAIAQWLIANGVSENSFVSVKMDRVKEFMATIIGIQKAGAAYVPIDPGYPADRIAYMQEDSEAGIMLDEEKVCHILTEVSAPRPVNKTTVNNRAYMIYTSGSTGRPKGVVIPQSALMAYAAWSSAHYDYREDKNYAHCVSFSFDASVTDLVNPMIVGATLHIISVELRRDLNRLAKYLEDNRIYGIKFPTQLGMLMLNSFPDMYPSFTVLGGEKLLPVERTHVLQYNEYGPTEFTVGSDVHLVDQDKDEDIPIGDPVPNSYSFVCDPTGNLLPYGYTGELCLAGYQIAEGYWKRPELTAEKFCNCPMLPGSRMYRTGDLVRYDKNGKLMCIGRIDTQVKLRGFRIELGEIENRASRYEGIREVAAEVRKGQLVLYYTYEKDIDINELKKYLADSLTDYMVPSVYVPLDIMPVTPVGKIDRKALPDPDILKQERNIVMPVTLLQEQLCGFFKDALSLEKVGINENFFELGGNSLMASGVLMKAKLYKLPLNYQDLFDHPTIAELEQLILSRRSEKKENKENKDNKDKGAASRGSSISNDPACLKKNRSGFLDEISANDLGDVLLVGGNGFLGVHVLKALTEMTDGKIYCLIRPSKVSAADRLMSTLFYYFEDDFLEYIGNRITVIEGDPISGTGMDEIKKQDINTVINCAASVKHFADIDFLMEANVTVVDKLIDLCLEKGARLIHTSTVSVGGDIPEDLNDPVKLTEDRLDIGQITETNGYVHTKFLAEQHVLKAIDEKNLDAKIMRLGNLMSRSSDGEFQMNFTTNNFFRTLWAYAALGCVPVSALDEKVEYSPINETARALLLLAGTGRQFTVFHPYNSHTVEMGDIIESMNLVGFPIETVGDDRFYERLKAAMADEKLATTVSPLLVYENEDDQSLRETQADNSFTTKALYRLGFKWSLTDMEYLEKAITQTAGMMMDIGNTDKK